MVSADELTVGGLTFSPASGDEACFRQGMISGCPFSLSIKLSSDAAIQAVVNARSIAEMQAGAVELMAKARSGLDDARQIEIRLERTLYGPGEFSEVMIHGPAGESITPEFCRGEHDPNAAARPYTGRVVLERFSPRELEGSYSAALYKRLHSGPAGTAVCNDEPVNIRGRFRFSLPVLFDGRYETEPAPDDLFLAVGSVAWNGGSVDWSAMGWPENKRDGIPGGAGAGEAAACDCSCSALKGSVDSACRLMCAADGLTCDADPTLGGEWTLERALQQLETLGAPPEAIQLLLPSMREASSHELRVLVESYRLSLSGSE